MALSEIEPTNRPDAELFDLSDIFEVVRQRWRAHVADSDGKGSLDCLSRAGTLELSRNHPYVCDCVIEYFQSDQLL